MNLTDGTAWNGSRNTVFRDASEIYDDGLPGTYRDRPGCRFATPYSAHQVACLAYRLVC